MGLHERGGIKIKNIREVVQMIVEELIDDGFSLRSQRGSHQRYSHHDGRKVSIL